jgi:hypothetical protein
VRVKRHSPLGVALALCRREGISVPERGYWAKLAHGKRVKRPWLQPAKDDSETLVIEATPSNRSGLESNMPGPLATVLRAKRTAMKPIAVSNSPKPHQHVEAWLLRSLRVYGSCVVGCEHAPRQRIVTP